jgi:hypothetical protein
LLAGHVLLGDAAGVMTRRAGGLHLGCMNLNVQCSMNS